MSAAAPYIISETIFHLFAVHFLGVLAACGIGTLVFFTYNINRETLGRIALVWLASTAVVTMLTLAAAVFGATLMITEIMVAEMEQEIKDPPPYLQSQPTWKQAPSPEEPTQPDQSEDKQ